MNTAQSQTRRRQGPKEKDDRLFELARHLTERDHELCRLLFEHRVFTADQVADLGFGTRRKAQQRLLTLHRLEVVDRFRPNSWSASSRFYYLLGPAGAAVVAAERGVEMAELGWRRDTAMALVSQSQLAHRVGCNGFFSALVRRARSSPEAELAEWWSARRCAGAWGELVRPDGYGVWQENTARLPFLVEYDAGEVRLGRLEAKLAGYAALARAAGHPTWVLCLFPNPRREAAARRLLTHPGVAIATAVVRPGEAADDARWQLLGGKGTRRRLIELGRPEDLLAVNLSA